MPKARALLLLEAPHPPSSLKTGSRTFVVWGLMSTGQPEKWGDKTACPHHP